MAFNPVTITVELDDDVAAQLAQFCKRSTFDTFFDFTEAHLTYEERRERAYKMINGIERIQAALAKVGHAPR
jgi:predicted transcriptional regulator